MRRVTVLVRIWLRSEGQAARGPGLFFSSANDAQGSEPSTLSSDDRSASNAGASTSGRGGTASQMFARMKQSNMAGKAANRPTGDRRPRNASGNRQPAQPRMQQGTFRNQDPRASNPNIPPPRTNMAPRTQNLQPRGLPAGQRPPAEGFGRQDPRQRSQTPGGGNLRQPGRPGNLRTERSSRPAPMEAQAPNVLPAEDDEDSGRTGTSRRERSQQSAKLKSLPSRGIREQEARRGTQSLRAPAVRKGGRGGKEKDLRERDGGPHARQSRLGQRSQMTASPAAQMLIREEGQYVLPPKEPFALMERGTKRRIRSTADLESPMTEEVEAIRADVMKHDPVVNFQWGAPVRANPTPPLDAVAEQYKDGWMEAFGIQNDEEWEDFKKSSLAGAEGEISSLNAYLKVRDVKGEEALLQMLRDSVPADHPVRAHVDMTVHELNRNPWWSFSDKYTYLASLVKNYG